MTPRFLRDPYATSLPPELTGGGEATPMSTGSPLPAGESVGAGAYDPDDHTVNEVLDYVDDHPDEVDAVLAAERAGKNRTTLIMHLEEM